MNPLRHLVSASILFCAIGTLSACGGGGGGGSDNTQARLQGTAFTPPGVDPGKIAEANAPVQVLDFAQPADKRVVATSSTDSNGHYDVTVNASPLVAVVVQGKAQVSGLILADQNKILDLNKDFTGSTDIACRAGVTALTNNILTAADFNATRIANLETAALELVSAGAVDFNSADSVGAAVQAVITETNYGAVPPPAVG